MIIIRFQFDLKRFRKDFSACVFFCTTFLVIFFCDPNIWAIQKWTDQNWGGFFWAVNKHHVYVPFREHSMCIIFLQIASSSFLLNWRCAHKEIFSKSYWIKPKSDCIYYFVVWFGTANGRPFVVPNQSKMVDTIWFRFDLIIFQKDFSVCIKLDMLQML